MTGPNFEPCRGHQKLVVKDSARTRPRANVHCYLTLQQYSLYLTKCFSSFRSIVSHPWCASAKVRSFRGIRPSEWSALSALVRGTSVSLDSLVLSSDLPMLTWHEVIRSCGTIAQEGRKNPPAPVTACFFKRDHRILGLKEVEACQSTRSKSSNRFHGGIPLALIFQKLFASASPTAALIWRPWTWWLIPAWGVWCRCWCHLKPLILLVINETYIAKTYKCI